MYLAILLDILTNKNLSWQRAEWEWLERQEASVDVSLAEAVGAAGYFKGAASGSEEDPSTPTREAGSKRPGVSQGCGPG